MSKYFKTSDGEEFYTENHAYNHARSLKDKTVTPPDVAFEVEEDEDETPKEVVANFSKMTKKQLVEFAVSKEIEVDEKATNAAIIAVIEEALAKEIEAINLNVINPIADEIGTKEVVIENTQE